MGMQAVTGERGFNWKGGRSMTANGYLRIWSPDHPLAMSDGYVLHHRMVVYDAGIDVLDGHHVHHINGDRLDNRLDNLEVVTAEEHRRIHTGETVVNQYGTWAVNPDPNEVRERRRMNQRAAHASRSTRSADAPHGTIGGYTNWSCRCDKCKRAYSEYRKRQRRMALAPSGTP